MTERFNAEQERARRYREASERWIKLEHERLNDIFATLGSVEPHHSLSLLQGKFSTLDKVRSSVEAGDRKAMLALLAIMTDSLRAFEVLPQEVREALADGLEKMRNNLGESQGFLPRKRGQKSADPSEEFKTALQVEYRRYFQGKSLEDARAKVSEEGGLTDSLIQKRWKRHHKEARDTLDQMMAVQEVVSKVTGIPSTMRQMPRTRKRRR